MDPLLRDAATFIDAQRSKKWAGARHLPNCRISQAVDGYWEAPCSTKCAEAARLVAKVAERTAAEQGSLFEEGG